MKMLRKVCTLLVAVAVSGVVVLASTSISSRGTWPNSWPKELDGLRGRATTMHVGWGNHEIVYEIPFTNREEFEAAWPHLLTLRSKGSPIIFQRGRRLTIKLQDQLLRPVCLYSGRRGHDQSPPKALAEG
jgi:hypothetical protein